jgi:hypothetical protein
MWTDEPKPHGFPNAHFLKGTSSQLDMATVNMTDIYPPDNMVDTCLPDTFPTSRDIPSSLQIQIM